MCLAHNASRPFYLPICIDGTAAVSVRQISYPVPGTFRITAVISHNNVQLAAAKVDVKIIGINLSITTPNDILAGVENTYTFKAVGFPATIKNVVFGWSFGDEMSTTGPSAIIPVIGGKSSTSTNFTYQANGEPKTDILMYQWSLHSQKFTKVDMA